MKEIAVTILGQSYLLGCPDGGDSGLAAAVARVDREMVAIRDGGKVRARERIAVLAALNLAYALAGREARQNAGGERGAGAGVGPGAEPADPRIDDLLARLDHALDADDRRA